uniref:Uncharacterized protein n=1 Tax=Mesocestoides corti TaxID=53468 RepID=A0A5K3FDV3_MESCO
MSANTTALYICAHNRNDRELGFVSPTSTHSGAGGLTANPPPLRTHAPDPTDQTARATRAENVSPKPPPPPAPSYHLLTRVITNRR